jgi:hypothetical protein
VNIAFSKLSTKEQPKSFKRKIIINFQAGHLTTGEMKIYMYIYAIATLPPKNVLKSFELTVLFRLDHVVFRVSLCMYDDEKLELTSSFMSLPELSAISSLRPYLLSSSHGWGPTQMRKPEISECTTSQYKQELDFFDITCLDCQKKNTNKNWIPICRPCKHHLCTLFTYNGAACYRGYKPPSPITFILHRNISCLITFE